ncbi:NAD(P)H-hydrate dehydratase [Desertimonas flava]|uniref:NAD(P)H-hydrate dehydratase n=1 Tax=Desertimonas flava TaxID=2064846 RepID=UPI000E351EB0|nr:NAD(P)H-hydrate dehydratase [Desertimonas flava]
MSPVVTPAEMAAIDAAAPEPVDVLIDRAGAAVARTARRMLGGTYGRVVNVVAGKGNNGNDGRVAAAVLAQAGVKVRIFTATDAPAVLPASDLVIDAAYGTGFRGEYAAPDPSGAPVLAVDIPSGVNGLTGAAGEGAVTAQRTITFAALKPGLVFGAGKQLAGIVEVADIGLDVTRAAAHVIEATDVARWLPSRAADAHKWHTSLRIVAGSSGMTGAARLATAAAMRAGSGMVVVSVPGAGAVDLPVEAVGRTLPATGWADPALDSIERFRAAIVGPGLGRAPGTAGDIARFVAAAPTPLVIDADGLVALGAAVTDFVNRRAAATVLTPHDGEFEVLSGSPPGPDRIEAARSLAAHTGAVVLLKGPTTTVADPSGAVRLVADGDQRLATAGTGDVLSGIIGALLAGGATAFDAAAAGAWLHAAAANSIPAAGLVASDVIAALPSVLAAIEEHGSPR